jgi:hypothetical protein
MPLSNYAQTALTPAAPTPTSGATPSLSSYAQAHLSNPDTQNYQNAFTTPQPPAKPTFLGAIGSAIKQTGSDFINAFKTDASTMSDAFKTPAPAPVPVTPTSYLTDIYGTMTPEGPQGGIVGNTFQAWTKTITDLQSAGQQQGVFNRGTGLAQAGLDAINAFFTPISTVFSEAAAVPGPVGQLANAINQGFSGLGKIGGNALANVVQATPALSPQQKATLTPLAQNIGSLAMQIIAGKATADTFGAMKDATHSFVSSLSEDARIQELNNNPDVQAAIINQTTPTKTLPVTSDTPTETPIPIKTTEGNLISNKLEPYTPDSQLPTIQMGPKAPNELPTIQTNAPASSDLGGGLKLVPEAPITQESVPTSEVAPKTQETAPVSETALETAPVKVQKTGEITKSASDINATLVKQGFDSLSPEEQSHYTPESYKEIADNLTKGDQTEITKMATGEIPVDKKLYGHGQILYKTISKLATANKDGELMAQLAKSPLGKKLSLSAQTLGESGYVKSDGSIDSVSVLRQLNDSWDAALQEKGQSIEKEAAKTETSMKQTARTVRSTSKAWSDFAKSITCGY